MTTRVYVPSSIEHLRELLVSGGLGPAPLRAHTVTDGLRSAMPDADEEELEYVALNSAAQDSVGVIATDDEPRRVVVVAEATSLRTLPDRGATVVELDEVLPLRHVVAVHADSDEAAEAVTAAREVWQRADAGDQTAQEVLDRCLDHDLGWFATQEIGDLVARRRA